MTIHRIRRLASAWSGALLGVGSALLGTAAYAQALEEIVVTARKREESLQTVPLVVEAFTADELEQRGMRALSDVSLFTPGFSFDNYNSGLASPVIRGATQQNVNALEQNVSSFLDGVYLPRGYVADLGLRDVERIEVIKGPQSARYGRNAFMGAINYVPVRPTDELRATVSISGGSDEFGEGTVAVGGPIIEGVLRARASYTTSTFDGTITNTNPYSKNVPSPGTEGNIGGYDREQWSASVDLTLFDALNVNAAWYHFDYEDEAAPIYSFANGGGVSSIANTNCGSQFLGYMLYCGTLPAVESLDVDPRGYGRQLDADIYRISADVDFGERVSAAYVFGRVEAETIQVGYSDTGPTCPWLNGLNGPGCVFQNVPNGGIDYDSHELRLRYDDDSFIAASLGVYLSEGDDSNDFSFSANVPVLTGPVTAPLNPYAPPFLFAASTATNTEDTSYFGEITLKLLDGRLRLGGEVRQGREEKIQRNAFTGATYKSTFDTTTPRVTVDFDMTAANLLYVSGAKGVRSGGFNVNAGLADEFRVYRPESNWTYELGSKNRFLDGALQVNGALFYVDAKDTQISSTPPGSLPGTFNILLNLGDYTSQGVELSMDARVAERFTLNAGVAYTDAEYGSAVDVRFITPCGATGVCPSNGSLDGRQLPRQSPWSATIGAQFDGALGFVSEGTWFARVDVAYQDAQFVDQMNLAEVDSRTLTNASLGATVGHFSGSIWARNLLDENYLTQSFFTPGAIGSYAPIVGQGRTFGATLTYKY